MSYHRYPYCYGAKRNQQDRSRKDNVGRDPFENNPKANTNHNSTKKRLQIREQRHFKASVMERESYKMFWDIIDWIIIIVGVMTLVVVLVLTGLGVIGW